MKCPECNEEYFKLYVTDDGLWCRGCCEWKWNDILDADIISTHSLNYEPSQVIIILEEE